MKKSLLILLVFLFSADIKAQSWCAPGATWVFRLYWPYNVYTDGFLEMRKTGTITVNGKVCDQIMGPLYGVYANLPAPLTPLTGQVKLVTYADAGVYFYESTPGRFDTLTNFNAKIGEGWYTRMGWDSAQCGKFNISIKKLVVTDTGHTIINGFNLKKLVISTNTLLPGGYLIVERIGPLAGYFFRQNCCYDECWAEHANFSCYKDDNFPVYSVGSATNCNFVGLEENSVQKFSISFFPNPGAGLFTYQLAESAEFQVMNAEGREVFRESAKGMGKQVLDLRALSDGFYFIKILGPSGYGYSKLVKVQN